SVPSIWGSAAVSGASRWLDAPLTRGPRPAYRPVPSTSVAAAASARVRRRVRSNGNTSSLTWDMERCERSTASAAGSLRRGDRPHLPSGAVTHASRHEPRRITGSERGSAVGARGPRRGDRPRNPEEPPEHHGDPEGEPQRE